MAIVMTGCVLLFVAPIGAAWWIPSEPWWSDGTNPHPGDPSAPLEQSWARGYDFQAGGTPYRGIDAVGAWDQDLDGKADSLGNDGVLVAVLSDGFQSSMDDFAVPGKELFTNDGYDYWEPDAGAYLETYDQAPSTDQVGTAVAEIIAGSQTNGNAYAGLAGVHIIPYRVGGADKANCDLQNTAWLRIGNALDASVSKGTDIVIMPFTIPLGDCSGTDWGLTDTNRIVLDGKLKSAYDAGVLIIAPQDDTPGCPDGVGWPASDSHVVAVAGFLQSTNFQAGWCGDDDEIDIGAPAQIVGHYGKWTLNPSGQNYQWAKTETTNQPYNPAAMVAGVAALVESYRSDLTNEEVRQVLNASARYWPVGAGVPNPFGWGILDANEALILAGRLHADITGDWDDPVAVANDPLGWGSAEVDWSTRPSADGDNVGTTHVVWVGPSGQDHLVYYAALDQSGNPRSARLALDSATTQSDPSSYPDISVDSQGYVHTAWIDHPNSGDGQILYRRLNPDGQPIDPIRTIDVTSSTIGPISHLNVLAERGIVPPNSARIYFVYEQSIGGDDRIMLAGILTDGTVILSPTVIANDQNGEDRHPSADISPERTAGDCGNKQCIYIAWERDLAGSVAITLKIVKGSNGADATPAYTVFSAAGATSSRPSTSVEYASGAIWVAWSTDDGGRVWVRASRFSATFSNGGSLSPVRNPMNLGVPVVSGAGGHENTDPTIVAQGLGEATVAWTGRDVENGEISIMASQLGHYVVPASWTRKPGGDGEAQIRVGSAQGNGPAFPVIVAAVDRAFSEVGLFDRSDGNVRFVWAWHEPPAIVPGTWNLHTSATRPWFTAPKIVNSAAPPGAPLAYGNSDISGDSQGGTHLVFEDRTGAVSRVRYRYWAPLNSPQYTNPTIDVVLCPQGACMNKATFLPRVLTTTTIFDGTLDVDAHIIFIAGTQNVKDNEVWIARFRPPNAAAVQGPATLPAEKTTNIAIVKDLDVIVMQDHLPETYATPGIGAAWTEQRNVNTGIVHAAVSIGGNAGSFYPSKQDETDLQFQANKVYGLPSLGFGPGGRLYVGFTDVSTNTLKLRMYSVSATANGVPTQRWELALGGGNAGMQVVIGVDRDLDLGSSDVNSLVRISDNQIHVVCVWRAASGSAFVYPIKYQRVTDKSDRAAGVWDSKEVVVDSKSIWAPGQGGGSSPYDFKSQPSIALSMTPENRVLLALSGKKDTGGSVQPMGVKDAVSLIGLNHLGAPELASEAFVAPSATYDGRGPHIVYRPGDDDGSTGATYQLVYTRAVNFDSFVVYQEAPGIPHFG